jgi:Na+-transporting NADH:ubiquinone oxidoreductase subunit NqrF
MIIAGIAFVLIIVIVIILILFLNRQTVLVTSSGIYIVGENNSNQNTVVPKMKPILKSIQKQDENQKQHLVGYQPSNNVREFVRNNLQKEPVAESSNMAELGSKPASGKQFLYLINL